MDNTRDTLKIVHIISGDRWAGAEVQAFTLLNELKSKLSLKVIVLNRGILERRLRAEGIEVCVFDESKHSTIILFFKIWKFLLNAAPHLIHTHRIKENILGNLANVLSTRAISVRTAHGAPEFKQSGLSAILPTLDQFVGNHLQQAVIAVSNDLAKILAQYFDVSKIHTIENGVDQLRLRKTAQHADFKKEGDGTLHIGMVGRLDPIKRVDLFLEAIALIQHEGDGLKRHFHLFGEGHLDGTLRAQATTLGLEQQITFHGHRSDISDCIYSLDLMVMPSDHEGMPMAVLEALALGTAVVAHDVGGLQELKGYISLVGDHSSKGYYENILETNRQGVAFPPRYSAYNNAKAILSLYYRLNPNKQGFHL